MFPMKVASILILLNFDVQSRVSLSPSRRTGGQPALRRRVGVDQPLGWENGWGVGPGQYQNLIREGSGGQDDRDAEEVSGSGDGRGVDDEDLVGEFETSAAVVGLPPPQSSSIGPPVQVERQERTMEGETKDWSEEYEYDSDNYIEVDDAVNYDTVKTSLPNLITESQLVLVTEGSEIVLPCQVGQMVSQIPQLT